MGYIPELKVTDNPFVYASFINITRMIACDMLNLSIYVGRTAELHM